MLLATIDNSIATAVLLLAQDGDWDYGNLIYLGALALAGVLNWVVNKYKEWTGDKTASDVEGDTSDGDIVYDVTLDDDDDIVLSPRKSSAPPLARKPARPSQPAQPVARPIQQPVAPRPIVAQPVQTRQPSQQRRTSTASKKRQPAATRKRQVVAEIVPDEPTIEIAGVPVRSLRDAVILSEVLAPPLAIRQIDDRNSSFERPNF